MVPAHRRALQEKLIADLQLDRLILRGRALLAQGIQQRLRVFRVKHLVLADFQLREFLLQDLQPQLRHRRFTSSTFGMQQSHVQIRVKCRIEGMHRYMQHRGIAHQFRGDSLSNARKMRDQLTLVQLLPLMIREFLRTFTPARGIAILQVTVDDQSTHLTVHQGSAKFHRQCLCQIQRSGIPAFGRGDALHVRQQCFFESIRNGASRMFAGNN